MDTASLLESGDGFSVCFIIPSLGRPTLPRAVQSLLTQTDPKWKAIIVYDGTEAASRSPTVPDDERVTCITSECRLGIDRRGHGNAGLVRNLALDKVQAPWTAFLDDDDRLAPTYVERLNHWQATKPDVHAFLFQALFFLRNRRIFVVPEQRYVSSQQVVKNHTPISFAVRTDFIKEKNITFSNDFTEDYNFLNEVKLAQGKIQLVGEPLYYVRNVEPEVLLAKGNNK